LLDSRKRRQVTYRPMKCYARHYWLFATASLSLQPYGDVSRES
jgi:hypothetical protein